MIEMTYAQLALLIGLSVIDGVLLGYLLIVKEKNT